MFVLATVQLYVYTYMATAKKTIIQSGINEYAQWDTFRSDQQV